MVPSSDMLCQQYQYTSDPIAMYVRDEIIVRPKAKTLKKAVYEDYRDYCIENGYQPTDNATFGEAMKAKGIDSLDSSGKAYYCVELRNLDRKKPWKAPKEMTLNHVMGEDEESEAVACR